MGEGSFFFFLEVGRYECQNDGLNEADTMGRMRRRVEGKEGREGWREGVPSSP